MTESEHMTSDTDLPTSVSAPSWTPLGLTIRATRVDDYEAITTLINLPKFRAGTARLPYQRPEQTRKWLDSLGGDALNIVAVLDGTLVGQAGLTRHTGRRAHAAELGIGVHDDHHGKGVGTALMREIVEAADKWLAVGRLELTVFADNAPAIRLYEKFGFENEGIRRAFAFRDGRYADVLAMARLRL
jgi:L-phenylalanine/L-methionine N-acetyltransferase